MTFIITATLSASVVYFAIALVACLHDCLMVRYRRNHAPTVELDFEALSNELSEEMKVFEAHLLPVAIAESTTAPAELPNSIRALREFVRSENLQDAIKQLTGKSVSNLKKDELHHAVKMAIA